MIIANISDIFPSENRKNSYPDSDIFIALTGIESSYQSMQLKLKYTLRGMLRVTENKGIIKIERCVKNKEAAAIKVASCVIRFLLGFIMGYARVFGNLAPFGVGFVASDSEI